jgi:hypothetical protein
MTPNQIFALLFCLPFALSVALDTLLGLSAQFPVGGQRDD